MCLRIINAIDDIMIRQPIVCVLGHVDHGKTSLLDKIRSTTTANREAGGITQHIGASEVPIDVIERISGSLLKAFGAKIDIPGLLFIDTPGHEAFTNLRKRGGSVADLAILVVDITKNIEPQTYEAINILKDYKTPFLIAANKIDLITGWQNSGSASFVDALARQNRNTSELLETYTYELIGKLSETGFTSDRYDRIKDFTREIAIFPISAKTGEGIAELLVYVTGLSQRFLEEKLKINVDGPAKGSIIEKKEEKGLGDTIDIILYNGTLSSSDTIAFATVEGIKTAKVKALLKPKALQELRESKSKFIYVNSASAAAGIKISGSGLEDALPGSLVVSTNYPNYEQEIMTEMQEVFSADPKGITLKADTIGSIEAISKLLKDNGVSIKRKELGNITRRDIMDAFSMKAVDPYSAVILGFNVKVEDDAEFESTITGVGIIKSNIIYKLIDDYKEWIENQRNRENETALKSITFPGEIRIIPNHCFRISHPAVFGVDVIEGRIKPSYTLVNIEGRIIGKIKEVQNNGEAAQEAKKGESVAISIDGVTFGRQINDNDILYTHINDDDMRFLRNKYSHLLNDGEREVIAKIIGIKEKIKSEKSSE